MNLSNLFIIAQTKDEKYQEIFSFSYLGKRLFSPAEKWYKLLIMPEILEEIDSSEGDISRLLKAWNEGDERARDQLIPMVHDDLRGIARRQYERERRDHTLQPTALVNELYLKLVNQRRVRWQNRREFFAVSAKLIRRILVDHARRRRAAKRGSDGVRISFDEALGLPIVSDPTLIALDDAIEDLEKVDPRGARVVELHVFGGLTFEEIAEVLGVARGTVFRDWKHARLWLRRYLNSE